MKKITSIIICLVIALTCCLTTGCAQFRIDRVKYYNEVLAEVGTSTITRYELLSFYNAHKSEYLTDDTDEATALKNALTYLEQQEALYLYSKEHYSLTANEKYNAIYNVFDTTDSALTSIKTEALNILNIVLNEEETAEEETEDPDKYTKVSSSAYTVEDYKYAKRATLVTTGDKTVIKYVIKDTEKVDGDESTSEDHKLHTILVYLDETTAPDRDITEEIKDAYFRYLKITLEDELKDKVDNYSSDLVDKVYNKIRAILADNLINYEYYLRDDNGNAYNTIAEDLFTRYFARVYDSEIKQAYIDRLKVEYFKTVEYDPQDLLNRFNALIEADYELYANKEDDSDYITKLASLGSAGDSLYYHEPLEDQKVGYFLHTLLYFQGYDKNTGTFSTTNGGEGYIANEQIKAVYYENDRDEYNARMADLINNMKINYRNEDGEFARDDNGHLLSVGIADVLEEYNQIVNMPTTTAAQQSARLEAFINFMLKYSKDDASLTSSTPYYSSKTDSNDETTEVLTTNTPYILGGNQSGKAIGRYEQAFQDEGIRILYSDDTMSKAITTTNGEISADDVPNLCITTYGIHFLYYVGDVDKYDVEYNGEEITSLNFLSNTLNEATGETYLDKLFDLVFKPAADSKEVYAADNEYESFEKTTYETILETSLKEYTKEIKGTKTTID